MSVLFRTLLVSLLLTVTVSTGIAGPGGTADSSAVFISDKTVLYDALKQMVRVAKKNILLRIFVVSDNDGVLFTSPDDQHPMAEEFVNLLIERKVQDPNLDIVLILDPINFVDYHQVFEFPWQRWAAKLRKRGRLFRGLARRLETTIVVNRAYPERYERLKGQSTLRERLRDAGITVLSANLFHNPEKNFFFKIKPGRDGAVDDSDVRLKTIKRLPDEYLSVGDRIALEKKMTFYQAFSLCGDHRKFAIIDDGALAWNASMNVWDNDFYSPDDGVLVAGKLAGKMVDQFEQARKESLELYRSLYRAGKMPELAQQYERGPYRYSPANPVNLLQAGGKELKLSPAGGELLRDGDIAARLVNSFEHLKPGSTVDIYQTLITDPKIIKPIVTAARRGVVFRILTDSYENVYGADASFTHGVAFRNFRDAMKDGASILVRAVVPDPRISEIHRKFALVRGPRDDDRQEDYLLTGSANFSMHSADGTQRELNILFDQGDVKRQARDFFDAAWENRLPEEQNMIPRLIREDWHGKDVFSTGFIKFLSLFGLGG